MRSTPPRRNRADAAGRAPGGRPSANSLNAFNRIGEPPCSGARSCRVISDLPSVARIGGWPLSIRSARCVPRANTRHWFLLFPDDVVSTGEARQLVNGNPLSFLHVTRSEIDLPPGTDPYADEVYAKARENFATLRRQAPMLQDDTPSLDFYRLRMGAHEQTGIAACFSVDEYEQDLIKKHERTRRDKEDDRTRHIIELGAQTGVVFLTFRSTDEIDRCARAVTADAPLYDFGADDGVHHTVWKAGAAEAATLVDAFRRVPALYIADGHHRAASAARARSEMRNRGDSADADSFIAVAFPENQMQILPYNRTVKDLAGQTPEQLLAALAARLPIRDAGPAPRGKGEVSMFLAGNGTGWIRRPARRQIAPAPAGWTLPCCSNTCSNRI